MYILIYMGLLFAKTAWPEDISIPYLYQMIVWAIQFLIQFDDQAFEEG